MQKTLSANPPQGKKLLEQVSDAIRTVQELLGHKACPERSRRDVRTTMIYTLVLSLSKGMSSSEAAWPLNLHSTPNLQLLTRDP